MKRLLLLLVFAFVVEHAPWRLMALCAETMAMQPSRSHITQADDQYWDALKLESQLINLGWAVSYDDGMAAQNLYGLTVSRDHEIHIEKSLHWNQRFAILAHEGGHTLEPGYLDRAQGEVFAESVAALVAHDGLREHARYLARVKLVTVVTLLLEWQRIYRAAALLED